LNAIIKETTVPRIRISSLDPQYLNDEFFEIVSDKRFCPHFHFSIQSFSDKVLKLMNRAYSSEKLDYVLKSIRNLNRDDKEYISI
jgi:threonylcarbamoyladenosine tRNA methylthiotransferase MtaB